jgi:hypothetical protein
MSPTNTHDAIVAVWNRLWTSGYTRSTPISTNTSSTTSQPHLSQPPPSNYSPDLSQRSHAEPKKLRRTKHHRHPPSSTSTSPLPASCSSNEDAQEEFGDILTRKPDRILHVFLQNVNRLPVHRHAVKSKQLISTIAHKQINIALLTEVGLYWKLIRPDDQWYERTRESFQTSRSVMAYNITEPSMTSTTQFGGVGIIATDAAAHRVIDQGVDSSGLGRWSWLRLEGKQNHFLRVVSAYRPVVATGPSTVHAQHERYLSLHDREEDPRSAFYTDLMEGLGRPSYYRH